MVGDVKTHLDFVYEHEAQRPDAIWLTQPLGGGAVRDLTWREAIDQTRRMATHLKSLPPGSNIALFAKNNAWWFLADLAIWMAGHVSVPLYPTLVADTVRRVLEHCDAKLLFVGKLDGFDAMAPGIPADLPRIALPLAPAGVATETWDAIIARTPPLAGTPRNDPDALATIVYTSGSTGVQKGVMHSFRTMAAAHVFCQRLGMTPDDRVLSYLPLAHVYERAAVETCSIRSAMRVFFAESMDTFVDDLRRARPTLFVSVPRLWAKFQQAVFAKMPPAELTKALASPMRAAVQKQILEGLGLADCRHAATGSAPIPPALHAWYRELGLDLLEGYAMSENFCVSHATRDGEVKIGYVGRPVDGVEQRISEAGEVLVKSPGTMLGYYKEDELTRDTLGADGFLKTGDRGELDDIGRLRITGRVKELFKTSKGKYVAPAPIENLIAQHDDVEQALVAGSGQHQPFVMVVLSDLGRTRPVDAMAASLAKHLDDVNARLDACERLVKLVVVGDPWTIENGLLTPTMKLKRDAIEGRYAERVERWYSDPATVLWA